MRDHGALGAAGGAGRVDQRGEIVGAARDRRPMRLLLGGELREGARAVGGHGQDGADLVGLGGALDVGDALGCHDDHGRLGVADEIFELGGGVGGVERIEDGADLQGGEVQEHVGQRLLGLHQHAVAGLHAQRNQGSSRAADLVQQLGEGQDGPVGRLEGRRIPAALSFFSSRAKKLPDLDIRPRGCFPPGIY